MLSCFPDIEPRPAQVKACNFVEKAIGLGYRDIVIEAPTGAGKSIIAVTACRYGATDAAADNHINGIDGGYILVHQKLLQDQIAAELDRFSSDQMTAKLIKSATEYTCINNPKKSCAAAKGCGAKKDGSCTYRQAKSQFLSAQVAVTNYSYFLAEREFVGDLADRRVLVLDEAHGLSSLIVNHVGIELYSASVREWSDDLANQLDKVKSGTDFKEFLKIYSPQAKARAEELIAMIASGDVGKDLEAKAVEFQRQALKVERLADEYNPDSDDWVFWTSEDRNGKLIASAKPLMAANYFNDLFPAGLRIFLSAYPGARETFCRDLGLDPAAVAWLRLRSDFPVEKRRVNLLGVASMSKRNIEAALPSAVRSVAAIVRKHKDERGVIHTHSYQLTQAVVNGLTEAGFGDRLIVPTKAEEREEAFERHLNSPNSVIISPSVYEGFDFRGDLARFQILMKCPYPGLGDRRVKTRADLDPLWYKIEAFKAFLQAAGRGVRSSDDWCVTYVIDKDFSRLLDDVRDHAPGWFLDAVVQH